MVAPAAVVAEPDALLRLLVVPAVTALGFTIEPGSGPPGGPARRPAERAGGPHAAAASRAAAVFVSLDQPANCRRVGPAAPPLRVAAPPDPGTAAATRSLIVGYGTGPLAVLSAHRAHGCADVILRLRDAGGLPAFQHLPVGDPVSAAGLTAREADVLVLLLAGLTTVAVAERLCLSSSTARSHCRAVLRKLGAGDRRALRARLLAGAEERLQGAGVPVTPRFA